MPSGGTVGISTTVSGGMCRRAEMFLPNGVSRLVNRTTRTRSTPYAASQPSSSCQSSAASTTRNGTCPYTARAICTTNQGSVITTASGGRNHEHESASLVMRTCRSLATPTPCVITPASIKVANGTLSARRLNRERAPRSPLSPTVLAAKHDGLHNSQPTPHRHSAPPVTLGYDGPGALGYARSQEANHRCPHQQVNRVVTMQQQHDSAGCHSIGPMQSTISPDRALASGSRLRRTRASANTATPPARVANTPG